MSKRRITAVNLIVILLLSIFFIHMPEIEVNALGSDYLTDSSYSDVTHIFIGDSRTMQLAVFVEGGKEFNFTTKEGTSVSSGYIGRGKTNTTYVYMGYSSKNIGSVKQDIIINLSVLESKGVNKSTVKVYYLMGVNGGQTSDNIEFVKTNIVGKGYKNVLYSEIVYGNTEKAATGGMTINNDDIKSWNKQIADNASSGGYTVIKCADTLGDGLTSDGVHLGSNSKKWFDILISASSSGTPGTSVSEEQQKAADEKLKKALRLDDEKITRIKVVISVLQADGFTSGAIAGMLGNIFGESGFNPVSYAYDTDGYTLNGGAFGFTPMHNFVKMTGDGKGSWGYMPYPWKDYNTWDGVICTHERKMFGTSDKEHFEACTEISCQLVAKLSVLDKVFFATTNPKKVIDNWNKIIDKGISNSDFVNKKVPYSSDEACVAKYKQITEWDVACVAYNMSCENSAANDWIQAGGSGTIPNAWLYSGNKMTGAKAFADYLSEIGLLNIANDPEVQQKAGEAGWGLVFNGYWSETDLTAYCKLNEIDINNEYLTSALRENLDKSGQSALANWNEQIKTEEENKFQSIFRVAIMVLGIILTIWAVFLYLAYWVDRINNFIEIDFVAILTFNKFRISEDESKCTYMIKDKADSKIRTVNHRAILFICGVMIGTGALMITGLVYKLVFWIISVVTGIFK